jgi:hypothetical protein
MLDLSDINPKVSFHGSTNVNLRRRGKHLILLGNSYNSSRRQMDDLDTNCACDVLEKAIKRDK